MDTPCVVVDVGKLEQNIRTMADFAAASNLKLRPHVKAHKTVEIALRQIAAGANGITVSKLGEAEVMFAAGIIDILLAYPLVGKAKLARADALLAAGCKLSFVVDSEIGARCVAGLNGGKGVDVLVKVDTGLQRCGLPPGQQLIDFCRWVYRLRGVNFRGILTHAGHVYASESPEQAREIGVAEGKSMVGVAEELRSLGVPVEVVSIGSTPTAIPGGKVEGVTEIRPGNYVFYDATQVALGIVDRASCSLTVLSTVVSRPRPDRAIIDAGAKVLALDKGAHGGGLLSGYGLLPGSAWRLTRLSEEHGVVEGAGLPAIGETLEIIPNHACPVVNLADELQLVGGGSWRVDARGKSR